MSVFVQLAWEVALVQKFHWGWFSSNSMKTVHTDNTSPFWFYFCSHISVLCCADKQDVFFPVTQREPRVEQCCEAVLSTKRRTDWGRSVHCAEFWRPDPGQAGLDKTGGASCPVPTCCTRAFHRRGERPHRDTHVLRLRCRRKTNVKTVLLKHQYFKWLCMGSVVFLHYKHVKLNTVWCVGQ